MAVAELSKPPSNTGSMEEESMEEYFLRVPDFGFTRCDRFPNSEVPDGFVEFLSSSPLRLSFPPTL